MADPRAVTLTGFLFLAAWCLPSTGNALLGPGWAGLLSCVGIVLWLRLVPAMPGLMQGVVCLNGLALLTLQAAVWFYCALLGQL
jgi:hypothetical protein